MSNAKHTHHREDIKAAIRKAGSTLSAISLDAGLHRCTASQSLYAPIPQANHAIAAFLKTSVHDLWPHWYDEHGERVKIFPLRDRSQKRAKSHGKKNLKERGN